MIVASRSTPPALGGGSAAAWGALAWADRGLLEFGPRTDAARINALSEQPILVLERPEPPRLGDLGAGLHAVLLGLDARRHAHGGVGEHGHHAQRPAAQPRLGIEAVDVRTAQEDPEETGQEQAPHRQQAGEHGEIATRSFFNGREMRTPGAPQKRATVGPFSAYAPLSRNTRTNRSGAARVSTRLAGV